MIDDIIDMLYKAMAGEGGDGWAVWYTEHKSLNEILQAVHKYNNNLKFKMDHITFEGHDIVWGRDQEHILITNDLDTFKKCELFYEFQLRY